MKVRLLIITSIYTSCCTESMGFQYPYCLLRSIPIRYMTILERERVLFEVVPRHCWGGDPMVSAFLTSHRVLLSRASHKSLPSHCLGWGLAPSPCSHDGTEPPVLPARPQHCLAKAAGLPHSAPEKQPKVISQSPTLP